MNNYYNYAIFPLEMLTDERYSHLSCKEYFLYMLLLNRSNISRKNLKSFCDGGGVFVYYTNQQITQHLKCSKRTAVTVLQRLEEAGLIKRVHRTNGLPLKIYVTDVKELYKRPAPKSQDVSFNVERAKEKSRENRQDFGEKKNKRRVKSHDA